MGFPKALMPLGDSFFLLTIYRKLVASGATPVHMVINTGLASSLEAQKGKFPDGTFVLNPEPGLGQIQSLRLGLRAAADGGSECALVALVDLPLVQEATIAAIAAAAAANPGMIVVPRCGQRRGHPMAIPRPLFPAFQDAVPAKTARDILAELAAQVFEVELDDAGIYQDVDSPEDLAKYNVSEDMD